MNNYFVDFILLIGMGYFVHLFARAFKFTHEEYQFSDVRKSSLDALMALSVGWVAISGLFLLFSMMGISGGKHQEYRLWNVIRQIMVDCLFFGPSLIMMMRRHETWSSSGITKLNIGKSVLLGVILSAFMFLFSIITKRLDLGTVLRSISLSDFLALIAFLVVGISEEFGFRGYLQTRLVLWLGKTQGWVLASTLMAVGHVIQKITIMGMSGMDALVSSLSLIPISLLFGYIMLRTENVVAGALLHTFIGWISVF